MDYLTNLFSLQLHDENDLTVAHCIEMSLRCADKADQIDRMVTTFQRRFPCRAAAYTQPWFTALINAIRPYHVQCDAAPDTLTAGTRYKNAFCGFMEAMLRKLNGNKSLYMGKPQFDLAHFSADELSQPHMQWLPIFVARHSELARLYPALRSVLRMAAIHPNAGVSNDDLLSLTHSYREEGFDNGMSYSAYVDWYVNSRAKFATHNTTLKPDVQAPLLGTLRVWHQSRPDQPIDDLTDGLCRNYSFHPHHRAFIHQWASQALSREAASRTPT